MGRIRKYFSVIFRIFARDSKQLVRNPIAMIILCGVCVLPALYAWYTIEANWDPYQNTGQLPVAVASNDKGADSSYVGHIDVGDEVLAKLHDNHQLDWQFTDSTEAVDGVYSGKYYAAIVFPENFSADFVSIFSGDFKKPQIDYYANEKLSGSATKVTDTGASTVENTINDTFVSLVSKEVVEISQKVAGNVDDKAKSADSSLTSSVDEARDAIGENREMVEGMIPTIEAGMSSVEATDGMLSDLEGQIPILESEIDSVGIAISDMRLRIDRTSSSLATDLLQASGAISQAAAQTNIAVATVSGSLERAKDSIDAALTSASRLLEANEELLEQLKSNPNPTPDEEKLIDDLEQQNEDLKAGISSLKDMSDTMEGNIEAISSASGKITQAVQDSSSQLQSSIGRFQTDILPQIDTALDSFVSALGGLRGALTGVSPAIERTQSVLSKLNDTLDAAKNSCESAITPLSQVEESLDESLTDLRALQNSASYKEMSTLLKMNPDDVAAFMSSPVTLETVKLYPVATYGSGVTPFFTNLALWVCGFILMAIVRIRVRPEGLPPFSAGQGYISRWMIYVVIGIIQSLVVCIGDLLLGIQCVSPVAFVATGVLTGFVYVNLMFALAYTMRHIGKAIAVVLLVMQIPGSSGMFPVEMLPGFYQIINPLLPFTYSIDAMREAIGGFYGMDYLVDMLVLVLIFVPIGILIGFIGVRYSYNVNMLFDQKLSATGLFIAESVPKGATWFRVRPIIAALLKTKEYKQTILRKARRFRKSYPTLMRAGWVALFALPITMLAVMIIYQILAGNNDPDTKLVILSWFIVAIIVVVIYLTIITYLNADIQHQLSVARGVDTVHPKHSKHPKHHMHSSDKASTSGKASGHPTDGGGTDA